MLGNASVDSVIDLGRHILDRRRLPQWFRQEIVVDSAVLAGLVRQFQMGPDSILDATLANDRLLARLSGQDALQIFPMSDTQYFYEAVNAQLTFELDARGRATPVMLHQNARDQIADRIASSM